MNLFVDILIFQDSVSGEGPPVPTHRQVCYYCRLLAVPFQSVKRTNFENKLEETGAKASSPAPLDSHYYCSIADRVIFSSAQLSEKGLLKVHYISQTSLEIYEIFWAEGDGFCPNKSDFVQVFNVPILRSTLHFLRILCFFQLSRLSELEEMVAEQDNALAVAAEKYKKSRNEINKMKKEHEEQVNNLKQQMSRSLLCPPMFQIIVKFVWLPKRSRFHVFRRTR